MTGDAATPERSGDLPNGPGAAALLAAGIGCFAFGLLALAGDAIQPVNRLLRFWPPSGALSGVSTCAVVIWLAVWYRLARRWRDRDVALMPVALGSVALLLVALLLTFPPFMDWLQGR